MNQNRRIRQNILFCFLMISIILMAVASDTVSSSVRDTLVLCYVSIIPSLFPFMVLSTMATKIISIPVSPTHRNAVILIPFILGALCGFPVGAASIAILFKNGVLSKSKAEYLCALCNNTGPAFIIGVIGKEFWHSISAGILLYICQILSTVIIFALWFLLFGKRKFDLENRLADVKKTNDLEFYPNAEYSVCTIFCTSVKESSVSVIKVCGFISFFKMLCDLLCLFSNSEILLVLFPSLLEFTTGSLAAAKLGDAFGMGICGFTIGFSGLSVIAQSTDFLYTVGLSALPLLKLKFFSGILCGIISCLFYNTLTFSDDLFLETTTAIPTSSIAVLTPMILFLAIFLYFAKKFKKVILHEGQRVR